jgi:DinB superfamily
VKAGALNGGEVSMIRAALAEARAFESWRDYQEALKRAIAPLSEEQLQRQLLPGLRTPGEIAEHIVFGRALHLHRTLGEGAAELTPLLRWGDADSPPHTAAEILQGLERTWQLITDSLMHGSPTDAIPEERGSILQMIWGLLDHDLPHAGELSLLLGAAGLPGVEI